MNTTQQFFKISLATMVATAGIMLFGASALAANTISSSTFIDADGDGQVDHAKLTFDANITACAYEAGDWSIDTAGTINVTAITGISTNDPESTGDGACDGTDAVVYVDLTADADVTGGATAPEITYTNQGTANSLQDSGNISTKATISLSDAAAPTFVSTSPAENATQVSRGANITITFSEPMDTTFAEGTEFTVTPDPGGFSASWSVGNTVLTIDAPVFACTEGYAVATDEGEIAASAGSVTAIVTTGSADGDFSFTTSSSGCGLNEIDAGDDEVDAVPDAITDIETSISNNSVMISWNTTGEGIEYYNVDYMVAGSAPVTRLASNISTKSYTWSVPSSLQGLDLIIKISGTDLATVLATETSDTFVIGDVQSDDSDDTMEDSEDVDDEVMPVAGVSPGDVIQGPDSSALYYVTSDYGRRVFMNEQSYFTWYSDFSNVRMVDAETLAALSLDGVMLPKAETVLVKIVSDPRVYALTMGDDMYSPVLRAISSEEVAIELYGNAWADYVIDVDLTFFTKFMMGTMIDDAGDVMVDMADLIRRVDLKA